MLAAAGTEFHQFAPDFGARAPDDEGVRETVAGKWVLQRFAEGSSVVAVPESLATSERLRAVVGDIGDRPIQVLRNDPPASKTEGVP